MTAPTHLTPSDAASIAAGCVFDLASAERVHRFIEGFCRHSKGQWAGQPFTLLPWQWERVVMPLYGWLRPDGSRRFRRLALAVPKKNGKSALLSALSAYHLFADREPGAEVYTAAASRDQASIIYTEATNMIEASPVLAAKCRLVRALKTAHVDSTKSVLKALSADVPTKDGLNASAVFFDELHRQPHDELYKVLRYAGAARRQPLFAWISTAGVDRGTVCWQQWDYALRVLSGDVIDTELLPVIYAAPEELDWRSEPAWFAANPSLGHTISLDSFRADYAEVERMPSMEAEFRRLRLNQWIGAVSEWIPEHLWKATECEVDTQGWECVAGVDLSAVSDLTAVALLFRKGDRYHLRSHLWCPRHSAVKREIENRVRFADWARLGAVTITESHEVDHTRMRSDIGALAKKHGFRRVSLDPWNANALTKDLERDGFGCYWHTMAPAQISAPTKEFERLVLRGTLTHSPNPCLDWMIGNTVIRMDHNGNYKPDKERSAEKIDGVVAAIIALGCYMAAPEVKPSKYSTGAIKHT